MASIATARHFDAVEPLAAPGVVARYWHELDTAKAIAKWDVLSASAGEPNPFFESWYLLPALKALDPSGKVRLLVLECDGKWLGLMPLSLDRRYYSYPLPQLCSWIHGNCFLGLPLIAAGLEAAFWRALLAWCDTNHGYGLFLHLSHLPLESAAIAALRAVLAEQQRKSAVVHREDRAMLASPLSPQAYWEQSLSAKKRKELRRQHSRLSELGVVTVERSEDAAGLEQWIDRFLVLEGSGWKGKAGSALTCSPETERLFREALEGAAQRGKLQRLSVSLDGRPIAMLASFLAGNGAFSFKTAFNEDCARFSPGVLLQRENLSLLDRDGLEWVDSCAAADHPMIDHIWRERRAIGRLSIAIGGTARRTLFSLIAAAETRGMTL